MSEFSDVKVTMVTASWCGPCKIVKPSVLDMKEEYGFELDMFDADSNAEDAQDAMRKVGSRGVPTVIFERDGKREFLVGGNPKRALVAALNKV